MPGATMLGDLTWTDVAEFGAVSVIAVPVGSTEQHGPHLPLGTDTCIAAELCRRLASRRADVIVAPAISFASSGEHAAFPGTLSIGRKALESLLVELGRSADSFRAVLFVSGHGGNRPAIESAVSLLTDESRQARAWHLAAPPHGDAHAGHVETSVMMALRPETVGAIPAAADGCVAPLGDVIGTLVRSGVSAVSANGVIGDASGSSPEAGERFVDAWVDNLEASIQSWPL